MTKKTPAEIALEVQKSLLETGEAFITKDGDVIDPETVSVKKDDTGKTVICVGGSIDRNVFALLANKGGPVIGDLIYPYQRAAMDALSDPGAEISLMRRWNPDPYYLHEHIIPKDRMPKLYPGTKLEMAPIDPPYHTDPTDRMSRTKVTPIVRTIDLIREKPDGRIAMMSVDNRMAEQFEKVMKLLAEMTDRIMFHGLFGSGGLPAYGFRREKRIASLLMSKDRRKVKRGNRLFELWRKNRPGYNLQRMK